MTASDEAAARYAKAHNLKGPVWPVKVLAVARNAPAKSVAKVHATSKLMPKSKFKQPLVKDLAIDLTQPGIILVNCCTPYIDDLGICRISKPKPTPPVEPAAPVPKAYFGRTRAP